MLVVLCFNPGMSLPISSVLHYSYGTVLDDRQLGRACLPAFVEGMIQEAVRQVEALRRIRAYTKVI
jgi:hypothetical protein